MMMDCPGIIQSETDGLARTTADCRQLTLCGCMGMPLKSVTILLADAMCTGLIPVRRPPIWSALHDKWQQGYS